MPINSRQKGAQGERELALEFSKLGFHAKRSQQHCGINSDSDIEVEELPGLLIECKRVQQLNLQAAMFQAHIDAAKKNKTPAICHRKNNTEWLVTVRLKDMIPFVMHVTAGLRDRDAS